MHAQFCKCVCAVHLHGGEFNAERPSNDFIGGVLQYAVDYLALSRGKPIKAPANFVGRCVVGLG